jgi:hypothetical protein
MDPDPYPSGRPTQAQVTRTLLHLGACVAACCTACAHTHPALRTTQLMPQCSAAVGVRGCELYAALPRCLEFKTATLGRALCPPFVRSDICPLPHTERVARVLASPSLSAPRNIARLTHASRHSVQRSLLLVAVGFVRGANRRYRRVMLYVRLRVVVHRFTLIFCRCPPIARSRGPNPIRTGGRASGPSPLRMPLRRRRGRSRVKTPTHCGSRDSWLLLNVLSLMFDPG